MSLGRVFDKDRFFVVLGPKGVFLCIANKSRFSAFQFLSFSEDEAEFIAEFSKFVAAHRVQVCEVLFDTDNQLFTVKSFSKKVKGKDLKHVISKKLEMEFSGSGVRGCKPISGMKSENIQEYLLGFVDTSDAKTALVLYILQNLEIDVICSYCMPAEMSAAFADSSFVRTHSLSDAENNKSVIISRLTGHVVRPCITIYKSRVSTFRVVVSIGEKILFIKQIKLDDITESNNREVFARELNSIYSYVTKSTSEKKESISVNVFVREDVLAIVSTLFDAKLVHFIGRQEVLEASHGVADNAIVKADDEDLAAVLTLLKIRKKPLFAIRDVAKYRKTLIISCVSKGAITLSVLFFVISAFLLYYIVSGQGRLFMMRKVLSTVAGEYDDLSKQLRQSDYWAKNTIVELNKTAGASNMRMMFFISGTKDVLKQFAKIKVRNYTIEETGDTGGKVLNLNETFAAEVVAQNEAELNDFILELKVKFSSYSVMISNDSSANQAGVFVRKITISKPINVKN